MISTRCGWHEVNECIFFRPAGLILCLVTLPTVDTGGLLSVVPAGHSPEALEPFDSDGQPTGRFSTFCCTVTENGGLLPLTTAVVKNPLRFSRQP